jgi:hypothetical protein
MMQFAAKGFWGRGIYFAQNSSYSVNYSYKPDAATDAQRPASGKTDEKEMFLAKLLSGNEVMMNRDESDAKKDQCR